MIKMETWTEKYRPKTLNDIIGNFNAVKEISNWADSWKNNQPIKKAIILQGKPGTGKTSSAIALGLDYDWPIIELNASDVRNASSIKKIATIGSLNETFDDKGNYINYKKGGKKLIILDEADNLYERSSSNGNTEFNDKGGKKAIIDTIKQTQQPIILIVNDYYSLIKGSGEELKSICKLIRFYTPRIDYITDLLKIICIREKKKVDLDVLYKISSRSNGDIRSAVNDLQSLLLNNAIINLDTLNTIGYRDQKKIIFDFLKEIFKTSDIKKIKESHLSLDHDPQNVLLWINENIPFEYKDYNDLASGYENIAEADIYLRRCMRRQNYSLWSYACDLMNGGVAVSKSHNYSNDKYYFPSWLTKIKKHKTTRNIEKAIINKIGNYVHISNSKVADLYLDYFIKTINNDENFLNSMIEKFGITENELKHLTGKKHKKIIKQKNNLNIDISKKIKKQDRKNETRNFQRNLF